MSISSGRALMPTHLGCPADSLVQAVQRLVVERITRFGDVAPPRRGDHCDTEARQRRGPARKPRPHLHEARNDEGNRNWEDGHPRGDVACLAPQRVREVPERKRRAVRDEECLSCDVRVLRVRRCEAVRGEKVGVRRVGDVGPVELVGVVPDLGARPPGLHRGHEARHRQAVALATISSR